MSFAWARLLVRALLIRLAEPYCEVKIMSQRAVERTLGKLVTDEGFREEFFRDPVSATVHAGLELTGEELDALSRIPRAALAALSARLDDRICRLHIGHEPIEQELRQ